MSAVPGCAKAVTPNDSTDLTTPGQLYIGGTGDVVAILENDVLPQTFVAHPVGYLPCRVRRVYSTGTTATNILVLSS